ncbi:MAG: hypothetical protein LUG17_04385, partial [Clostridiales bacterium]|nr:hypothetical protein [Clostridiales bacterium]
FCLYYAGISTEEFPEATGAYAWSVTLKDAGLYESAENHVPVAGDLIFFDTDENGKIDTVGIVTEVDEENSWLTVIEGDCANSDGVDAVVKHTYSANDGTIVGYGVLPEQETTVTVAAMGDIDSVSYTIEAVQALMDSLPSVEEVAAMDNDGQLEAYTQAQTANDAYESLSETEQAEVDVTALDALFEYFNGLTMAIADEDGGSEAGTTTKSLQEYIASVNAQTGQSASITLNLRTESDSDISEDDSGTKTVTTNTAYHLALTVYSSAGFEANTTYTYSLPDGVTVEAATGSITTADDGTVIGTWTVSADGTVTLAFNEKAAEHQDVEITFTDTATITTTEKTITIGDTTYTVSETTNLSVNKSGNYKGYTKGTDGYYHGRAWEIEFSQHGVPLSGTTVTDYATDSSVSPLHGTGSMTFENQHFDTSQPLSISIVDATDSTVWTWTVDWTDSNLTLYTLNDSREIVVTTDTSARIIGWKYTFPESVSATDSSGDTVTLDLETTDMSPYEIHIYSYTAFDAVPDDNVSRVAYYNTVDIDNGVETGWSRTNVSQTSGIYGIEKDWSRGDDGISVDWTVTATIPGGTMTSYELIDIMTVRTGTSTIDANISFSEYSENVELTITVPAETTINGTAITAGTYTVYKAAERTNNTVKEYTVPDDAVFVYYYIEGTTTTYGYFVLGMKCCCGEGNCTSWSNGACSAVMYTNSSGEKYCACWQLDKTVTVNMTYTTSKEDMLTLLNTYGHSEKRFYNNVTLYRGTYNDVHSLSNTTSLGSATEYVGLALAGKTLETEPTMANDYTASYSVVINTNHLPLTENGADLTITDTLSTSLTFLPSSLNIQATDKDGTTTTLTSSDYSYTYDSDSHAICVVK